jgi:hypothetical protein
MLASGTQYHGFAPDRTVGFFQHAFLRRGSKRICPMSQLWGMLKNPALFVNSEIACKIPLVPSSASRVRCVSDWYTAPLVVKEGSPRGEGTIGLTKPQCRINPEKRPFIYKMRYAYRITKARTGTHSYLTLNPGRSCLQ